MGNECKGVLYVGTRTIHPEQGDAFSELDTKILRVFGEIAGEIIGRRQLNQQAVQGALELFKASNVEYGGLIDLRLSIKNLLERVTEGENIYNNFDDNILLILAVRIINYQELSSSDSEIGAWVASEVSKKNRRDL